MNNHCYNLLKKHQCFDEFKMLSVGVQNVKIHNCPFYQKIVRYAWWIS